MIYYDGTGISERIGVSKSKDNKKCIVCHCWSFENGFKFQNQFVMVLMTH